MICLRVPNKKQLMALYQRIIVLCKQKKNQTFLNNPSTNRAGLQYLTEVALIEKAYNPFTSIKDLTKAVAKFEGDADFKKLLNQINAFVTKRD
ncbi:MAG TPA: hypothetical protein DCS93_31050 [Microscillaceae bacterium]|nr:hypothetical protein [Microscillaceae bacterium]